MLKYAFCISSFLCAVEKNMHPLVDVCCIFKFHYSGCELFLNIGLGFFFMWKQQLEDVSSFLNMRKFLIIISLNNSPPI